MEGLHNDIFDKDIGSNTVADGGSGDRVMSGCVLIERVIHYEKLKDEIRKQKEDIRIQEEEKQALYLEEEKLLQEHERTDTNPRLSRGAQFHGNVSHCSLDPGKVTISMCKALSNYAHFFC